MLEPDQGLSLRGTSDDKLISGDVLRKLLGKLKDHVDLNTPLRLPPYEPILAVKVRTRASRRAVKGAFAVAEAEARAQRVAIKLMDWYNNTVGKSLLDYASVGPGRRIHIVDRTHVEVPRKSTRLSYAEAVQLAELQGEWQPHPSRDQQHIAFVPGVDHLWEACKVPLNACVIRYWNRKKDALEQIVLVTTDQRLTGPWIVRHYEERLEMAQDYEQMKSGGWQLQKLRSTRYSEIVLYIITVVLSYSLYQLFANTQAGACFARKTRQALAFEQLRSRRTHVIVYAGGYFEIFETLRFAHFIL